jgi:hypothetical protein
VGRTQGHCPEKGGSDFSNKRAIRVKKKRSRTGAEAMLFAEPNTAKSMNNSIFYIIGVIVVVIVVLKLLGLW